jgi:hypothetical protein
MVLSLCAKDDCSLDEFVQGIRTDIGKPITVSRSKRKKAKANEVPVQSVSRGENGAGVARASGAPDLGPAALDHAEPSGTKFTDVQVELEAPKVQNLVAQVEDSGTNLLYPATQLEGGRTKLPDVYVQPKSSKAQNPLAQLEGNGTTLLDIQVQPASSTTQEVSEDVNEQGAKGLLDKAAGMEENQKSDVVDEARAPDAQKESESPEASAAPKAAKSGSKRSTRRSGRFTRHGGEPESLVITGPEPKSEASPSRPTRLDDTELHIKKSKKSISKEIKKSLATSFQKEMLWPVAGRKPFATLGNLPPRQMKRLGRNAGIVKAPHVAYNTNHEVGQVCWAHIWRKRTEQCSGLEELLHQVRVLESYFDRQVRKLNRARRLVGQRLDLICCFLSDTGHSHLREFGSTREKSDSKGGAMLAERPRFWNC